jgi:sporulation protein YlmC with PRC-barrel domain
MIRHLLATTAVATLVASGALAQTQPAPADPNAPANAPATEQTAPATATADGFLATNLIGETVYNGTGDDAENIGEVNDLVISKEGAIETIVVGVGGFLGIGEKNVGMEYDKIDWAEKDGDRWIVVAATKDELNALPAFDPKPYDLQSAPATATDTTTAPAPTEPSTAEAPAAPTDQPATAEVPAATDTTKTAAIDKSALKEVPATELRSEELVGTTVYGANDENIGEIGDIVLGADQKVESIIIDVGGFLGVGEKEVAVGMDNLAFMTDEDGNKYLYTNFTKEQLNAQPTYDESSYAEKRDEQRLIMKR